MGKIAIHGFGRIGRSLLKAALRKNLWSPFSVSDIRDTATFAALFEVDSNYGRWHEPVSSTENSFTIGGREIKYFCKGQKVITEFNPPIPCNVNQMR